MEDINLLPDWYTAKSKLKKYKLRMAAVAAVIFIPALILAATLNFYLSVLERRAAYLAEELRGGRFDASDAIVLELNELNAERETLEGIAELLFSENIPVDSISALTGALPESVRLRQLNMNKADRLITLRAQAWRHDDIPGFIRTLARYAFFEEASLTELAQTDDGGAEFLLELRLKHEDEG